MVLSHEVPSQLTWWDLLNSEDIDGITGTEGASTKISGGGSHNIRVATRVAESREIAQKSRRGEFGYVLFKA